MDYARSVYTYTFNNVVFDHTIEVQFYEPVNSNCYVLTINNGTYNDTGLNMAGLHTGDSVTIIANTPPTGQVFDKWTGDVAGISNINSATTTFTMGTAAATVTATYKTA
jgi:hypothetical protein